MSEYHGPYWIGYLPCGHADSWSAVSPDDPGFVAQMSVLVPEGRRWVPATESEMHAALQEWYAASRFEGELTHGAARLVHDCGATP